MGAGFFANCRQFLGHDGLGKRFVVAAFLLLFWLTPAVYAAAAGVLVPFPDKGEDPARPKRPVLPGKMLFPGTLSPSPAVPVQVHPLFPQDGAIFPPGAAATVAWRMPDEEALPDTLRITPKYFRVELIGHTYPVTHVVKYFPYNGKKPTFHGIFNSLVSGKYSWQVTAVMDDASIIKSPARYFIVNQPNYYDNYFDVVQDVYPHYYYDSQEFRRR